MALMGAGGKTATEIADGLRVRDFNNATIAKEYAGIISSLKLK